MKIEGPYKSKRDLRKGIKSYITILKICIIIGVILTGAHVVNQLDRIMSDQADLIKTQSDAMDQLMWIRMDLDKLIPDPEEPPETISLGEYTITHYCPESCCCGKWANGYTATGTKATEGRTIAVDPKIIPYGTTVVIDDHEYIAEDCGGAIKGNKIDIFCDSHTEALSRGVIKRNVYIKEHQEKR